MNARVRWAISLAAVGLLFVFHVHLKTTKIFLHPEWDEQDAVGQFWSEFAFHYRFAQFFAEHPVRDWAQLAHDRSVQYPDAVNDWAEFTIVMEVPAGVLYRWLQPALPFHVWIVWYDCIVGSLGLFGVFLLGRLLWRGDFAGILAAALYASLYPSYGRTVKNLFLREDFALPLILFALAATVWMLQQERRLAPQLLAAGLWLAALASWHLTQFVLAAGLAAAVLVYLGHGETPRRPWFVATLAAGSLAVPVLWAKQFWLSPAMCVLYALTLAVWINGGRKRASLVFVGWLVPLLALSYWCRQSYGEYAHVYQLFLAKLRFLGAKPADPGRLTWEARCLWEGAFETAGARAFWQSLAWTLPLGFVAAWRIGKLRLWKIETRLFVVFALLLLPLAWMVVRYFTFLAPVAAVLTAALAVRGLGWKVLVGGAATWQLVGLDYAPLDRAPVHPAAYRPVVRWVAANTPAKAVVLAGISESPVLWAHTGRAMVLHSKFENQAIRDRYREYLAALYGTEADLHQFARRYGADYFLYDLGTLVAGKNSWRYKADKLGPLPPTCPARLLAEHPNAARYFQCEYIAGRFAVFRVR